MQKIKELRTSKEEQGKELKDIKRKMEALKLEKTALAQSCSDLKAELEEVKEKSEQ